MLNHDLQSINNKSSSQQSLEAAYGSSMVPNLNLSKAIPLIASNKRIFKKGN